MFEYAKTKVAMGNAASGIKKLADYVTTDIFHYGIKNGLEHLGLFSVTLDHFRQFSVTPRIRVKVKYGRAIKLPM